ncbi:MAG: response regulator transcription factor [Chloroflexi bacterium]|nr:response regulator transcription factor [Chloroflexota bacterium]
MPITKTTLLIVDDDVRILRLLQNVLETEGYSVLNAANGEECFKVLEEESVDLILLDVMMPGMDGYEVCHRIREFSRVPIIMVTAKGNQEEIVEGLEAGADDYVTKPFSSKELTVRIKAVLRRATSWGVKMEPSFTLGELVIDFSKHLVTVKGQEINLTATEYKLLVYLATNAGRVLTTIQILKAVWGEDYISDSHLLQVNAARLRQKLGDDAKNSRYVITKPGIGYSMNRN